jgi:hypothetical protein
MLVRVLLGVALVALLTTAAEFVEPRYHPEAAKGGGGASAPADTKHYDSNAGGNPPQHGDEHHNVEHSPSELHLMDDNPTLGITLSLSLSLSLSFPFLPDSLLPHSYMCFALWPAAHLHHSLEPPFSRTSPLPFWDDGASAKVHERFVRLTEDRQSRTGFLWNNVPVCALFALLCMCVWLLES